LRLALSPWLSSISESRFTLLGFLLSYGDPERGEYSSAGGGDADRLEWLVRTYESCFPGDNSSSSSVSDDGQERPVIE
jgi:hypothetical protein